MVYGGWAVGVGGLGVGVRGRGVGGSGGWRVGGLGGWGLGVGGLGRGLLDVSPFCACTNENLTINLLIVATH
jgi:hypothetical protein